jgi:alkylation response protein AidB-like acyl-CoA dehydrogenase
VITVDEFAQEAKQWLAENKHLAPRDYGAICPPDMVNEGLAWQRHLYASGKAGIHWPVEFGGQGLTAAHQAQWLYECALVGVPGVFNMVGLVLTGGAVQKFGTPEQQAKHLNAT